MSTIDTSTWPLLPSSDTLHAMRAFPSSVYKVDEQSILYKYMDALLGDAGVGGIKKQLLISRLNQRLDTTFFTDLDRVFGNLGSIARTVAESYSVNPSVDLLTTAEWDEIRIKDSWYRARIKDFFAALALGGTPDGIRKMVKAAIGVDSEIYELWRFQDFYGDIYGIADIEAISNLVRNPSFEYGTTGWSITNGGTGASIATATSPAGSIQSGVNSLLFNTGTSVTNPNIAMDNILASPSKQYTLSFYYYAGSISPLTTVSMTVSYFNIANGLISNSSSSANTLNLTTQTRVGYTFTTPALTDHISVTIKLNGVVTTPSVAFYIDAVQVSAGASLIPYFDGDTSGYRWTGAAGESLSIQASPIDALSRIKVPSRNEIVIYPHKASLTVLEKELVREMVTRLAPVDSVITIKTTGYAINKPIPTCFVAADSSYFQINSFVTGTNIQGLTEKEEPNATHRWLQNGVETLAPNLAFMDAQEYSQYYIYAKNSTSAIDSVQYQKETPQGVVSPELDYQIIEKTASGWTQWTRYDLADCAINYPGGKSGLHPTTAPALNKNGSAYIFPYTSQRDYVDQMNVILGTINGQTRTFKEVYNPNPYLNVVQALTWMLLTPDKGENTEVEYRFPIAATEAILNSWQAEEAVTNVTPVRASTISSGWFQRPYAANKQF